MKRAICGFHLDAEGDWVADLGCGHTQHVRHKPPWTMRPWVVTEAGRQSMMGQYLECKICDEESTDVRARVLALLKRHGWNATSFQALEQGFEYWFDEDACVAYADTKTAWVVAGAPIAAESKLASVAARFEAAAAAAKRRVIYFAVEQRFLSKYSGMTVRIGEQAVWRASEWAQTVADTRSLKEQIRRAKAKGVVVRALTADELREDAPIRRSIEALIEAWLAARPMPPMGFLVDVQPFSFPEERRYFVAEKDGALVAFLAAVPVFDRRGWLIEDLLRNANAPNGTNELVIDHAMRAIADAGDDYVTLGLAPLSGPVDRWLSIAHRWSLGLYDFRGLRMFKAKLRPAHWEPIYLAAPESTRAPFALYDILKAFARGSLARFSLQTVLRGPAVVVQTLAALLIPWTIALACADPALFPSVTVQRTWIVFDVLLCVGLFRLSIVFRQWLATLLASAVTADAVLTLAQAVFYNVPRARTWQDWLVIAVAVAAPSFASLVLWKARSLRQKLIALSPMRSS